MYKPINKSNMNYKLIKKSYQVIGVITLILSIFTIFFIDDILERVSVNFLIICSVGLCIPFFVLRVLYERKYPVPKKQKIIGYSLGLLLIIVTFFI